MLGFSSLVMCCAGPGPDGPTRCRIASGRVSFEQLAVLDEQQAVDDQARHRVIVGVGTLRVRCAEHLGPGVVQHGQAGRRLLVIDRKRATIDRVEMTGRQARLVLHLKPCARSRSMNAGRPT